MINRIDEFSKFFFASYGVHAYFSKTLKNNCAAISSSRVFQRTKTLQQTKTDRTNRAGGILVVVTDDALQVKRAL